MENIIKYSEFEYKKVLNILKFAQQKIIEKDVDVDYYELQIHSFEEDFEGTNILPDLEELSLVENLNQLDIIFASFHLGGVSNPVVSFTMKQKESICEIEYYKEHGPDFEALDEPKLYKSNEWEVSLSMFLKNIKTLIGNGIKYPEDK